MKKVIDDITGYIFEYTSLEEHKQCGNPFVGIMREDTCSAYKFDDSKPLMHKIDVYATLFHLFGVRKPHFGRHEWIDKKAPQWGKGGV